MRIFFFLTFILFLSSCATVEVAREVTRAGNSVKNSVNNMIEKNSKNISKNDRESKKNLIINENLIKNEKKKLENEKNLEIKIIKEQKNNKIKFLGKKLINIESLLGKPQLTRLDGNTKIVRFDSLSCRIFLFFNSESISAKVNYYELRNLNGNLIIGKNSVQKCYKEFRLI